MRVRDVVLLTALLPAMAGLAHPQAHADVQGFASTKVAADARPKASIGELWTAPDDISHRDLRYGIGGEQDAPKGPFTFVGEKSGGNSPKFDVKDEQGREWRAKLGPEARAETAATRILWAVGYYTDEDYFVPELELKDAPAHLSRGGQWLSNGQVHRVRLELKDKRWKSDGSWKWKKNPFSGTREFNGLRVMMAVLNNWDLKDENNTLYRNKESDEKRYVVADVGASFGKPGRSYGSAGSKDNPRAYSGSKFIVKKTDRYVSFNVAQRPPLIYVFNIVKPLRYWQFVRLQWIGKKIPRADAKWIGGLLAQLSDDQLRAAFVSSGYDEKETDTLVGTLRKRIAQLNEL